MEKHITHTKEGKSLSRFLQILDGSFPSGAFVHSFGLEPHIVLEKVTNSKKLKQFLMNLIEYQYKGIDFVFAKRIYDLLKYGKLSLILKEEKNYCAMLNFEYAKASQDLGQNYLKQIHFDIRKDSVQKYFSYVKDGKSSGNELAILSAYAFELDLDIDLFLLLWCKKNITNISMASLKISRIKPSEIQTLLFEFDEILETQIQNSSKNMNSFNPLFEEVIYQHKILEPKMFVT